MTGVAISDVLDEPGRRQLASHLEELRSTGPNTGDVECSYLRPDGSPVPLMVGESVLRDEDGSIPSPTSTGSARTASAGP